MRCDAVKRLRMRSVVAAVVALLGGAVSSNAAIIARYDMESSSSATIGSSVVTVKDANVTASNITRSGSGLSAGPSSSAYGDNGSPPAAPFTTTADSDPNSVYFDFSSVDSTPISTSNYINFTLTPAAGKLMDITSMQIMMARESTNTLLYDVRSSLTGATSLASGSVTTTVSNADGAFQLIDIDVSDPAFTGITPGSGVEFRILVAGSTAATQNRFRIDKFDIQGSVPEPASLGLLGMATIGLLARRRRVV